MTSTLRELFELELQDTYSAETQLVEALPQMAEAASSPELRAGFEQHLLETQNQVRRLEQIADELDISLSGNTCEAMEGLVEEGEEIIDLDADGDVRDAGLIASAQKVEHYEIASYGTLCAWAKQLGLQNVASMLAESLNEERRTDEKLTQIAERMVNLQAASA